MIKFKDLQKSDLPLYRFSNKTGMSMDRMVTALSDVLAMKNDQQFHLPIQISHEQVKMGGFFSGRRDAILIQNTEHSEDYLKFCLILEDQRNIFYVKPWYYGKSALGAKAKNGQLSGLGAAIRNSAFGTNDRWMEEKAYYSALSDLLDSTAN